MVKWLITLASLFILFIAFKGYYYFCAIFKLVVQYHIYINANEAPSLCFEITNNTLAKLLALLKKTRDLVTIHISEPTTTHRNRCNN